MCVPIFADFASWPVFISFLVLEATVGMFGASGGILRSKYYPGKIQSSVMSVFRVILNALVVLGTYLTSFAGSDTKLLKYVYAVVVLMHVVAFSLQMVLQVKNYPALTGDDDEKDADVEKKKSPMKAM